MNQNEFEALFLKTWQGWENFVRWFKFNYLPACWFIFFCVAALFAAGVGASPRRTEMPRECRTINDVEVCLVTKVNLDFLISEYDKAVALLRKTQGECAKLNNS